RRQKLQGLSKVSQCRGSKAKKEVNKPARKTGGVNEKVEDGLDQGKQEWQLQWEGERRRLNAEIDRLRRGVSSSVPDEKKEAARRAVLEKLGKLPPGSAGPLFKNPDQSQKEFEDAKIAWETERESLKLRIKKLEMELQRSQDSVRAEISQEMRGQYEPRIQEANRERQQLEQEIQSLTNDLASERKRLNSR